MQAGCCKIDSICRFCLSKSTVHEVLTEFMQRMIDKFRSHVMMPTIASAGPSPLQGCVGYVDGLSSTTHSIS